MDQFYEKIQGLLMRKNNEYELKSLSSNITQESADQIDDLLTELSRTFQNCGITIGDASETDNKCVKALQYLIFNTNFNCQDQMAEDIISGHLVDMCPALSPYLLITITYKFNYELLLTEMILYCPLELCVEIMETVPRCLNIMSFECAKTFIFHFISNAYKKLLLMKHKSLQSSELDMSLNKFAVQFQELVSIIRGHKLLRLDDDTKKKKERLGFIIKDIAKLILECLEYQQKDLVPEADKEKLYKITFGREFIVKPEPEAVERHLGDFNAELLSMLSAILQEVDIDTYLEWAELDSPEDSSKSLQQSVGADCYNLIEALKKSEQLKLDDDLVKCLEHLASKPKQPSDLSLEELCRGVDEGKKECLKQLTNQYQKWDPYIFQRVKPHFELFDKDDFLNLLEYLTDLIESKSNEDHKQRVYNLATKILLKLEITEVYEVAVEYILKHDAKNILESVNTEEMFNGFITCNTNFKDSMKLRILLFFIMKNPRKFLMTVIKMSIGSSEFPNVMIPAEDLLLLSPIMKIFDETSTKLVLSVLLENIGLKRTDFKSTKFYNFLQTLIDNDVFTADELTNVLFVPLIEDTTTPVETVRTIMVCIHKIIFSFTEKLNLGGLLVALAARMKLMRRNKQISKCDTNEILDLIIKIVRTLIESNGDQLVKPEFKAKDDVIKVILPIDQIYFKELLSYSEPPDITDIIRDYGRRVVLAIARVFEDSEAPELDIRSLWIDFKFHLILTTTEEEFVRIATELSVIHPDFFDPQLKEVEVIDAVIEFVGLTSRAWSYSLELPKAVQPKTFGCLIRSLAKFIKLIMRIKDKEWEYERISNSLRDSIKSLACSIKDTGYEEIYQQLVQSLDRPADEEALESILQIAECLESFGNSCLQINVDIKDREVSMDLMKLQLAQEFIDNCLRFEIQISSLIIKGINELHTLYIPDTDEK
ncbi:uncharacterized protein LOC103569309 [Microplitis demolitor]|uniref:uncharacterized protein LOC103569309 n=1 Tax=Microplitis demolitor TaxID=69319 RepID=UPI0004CC9855|nr:uncharacterized protein LOC103569309 [Microplitis demolitor]